MMGPNSALVGIVWKYCVFILAQCVSFYHIVYSDIYLAEMIIYIFITFSYFCDNSDSLFENSTTTRRDECKEPLCY